MSTLLLAAISGSGWQTGLFRQVTISIVPVSYHMLAIPAKSERTTYIAFPADHLVAVVLASKSLQAGFNDTATEAEDEMEG